MTAWDKFFREKIEKIFREKRSIIDIGGGLRALKGKGNRYDPSRGWIKPLIEKADYKILDPVQDYHPDIVGDIHNLPFADNSQEAIICLAVLEHVRNPIQAVGELLRVLKPGGYCFVYVPFLYYYHSEKGYYKDYWRFTKDAVDLLFRDFSAVEMQSIRGAVETWVNMSPLGKFFLVRFLARFLDYLFNKFGSSQVSGYYVFLTK